MVRSAGGEGVCVELFSYVSGELKRPIQHVPETLGLGGSYYVCGDQSEQIMSPNFNVVVDDSEETGG